jgi:hypothetical protein
MRLRDSLAPEALLGRSEVWKHGNERFFREIRDGKCDDGFCQTKAVPTRASTNGKLLALIAQGCCREVTDGSKLSL